MALECALLLLAGRVLDAAALIMRAVAEGGANAAAPMREAALTEGAILHHLSVGMSSTQARACCSELSASYSDKHFNHGRTGVDWRQLVLGTVLLTNMQITLSFESLRWQSICSVWDELRLQPTRCHLVCLSSILQMQCIAMVDCFLAYML